MKLKSSYCLNRRCVYVICLCVFLNVFCCCMGARTLFLTVANRSSVATKLNDTIRIELLCKCTTNWIFGFVIFFIFIFFICEHAIFKHFGSDPNDSYEQFSIFNCHAFNRQLRYVSVCFYILQTNDFQLIQSNNKFACVVFFLGEKRTARVIFVENWKT